MIKNIILKPKGPFSLKKLAGFTKDKIIGKSNIIINKISSVENAISFLNKHRDGEINYTRELRTLLMSSHWINNLKN